MLVVSFPVGLVYLVPRLPPDRQFICSSHFSPSTGQLRGEFGGGGGGGGGGGDYSEAADDDAGARLTFVVGVEGRRVEDDGPARVPVRARVAVPQVPVDQGRPDRAAARLQRPQQARHDLPEERPRQPPDLVAGPAGVLLQPEQRPRRPREVLLPPVRPAVLDRDLPVEGGGVEAEELSTAASAAFASASAFSSFFFRGRRQRRRRRRRRRRHPCGAVQLGDHRREGLDVRQAARHRPELAEEEVDAGQARVRAPGERPRDEAAGGRRVELLHAVALARQQLPPALAVRGLGSSAAALGLPVMASSPHGRRRRREGEGERERESGRGRAGEGERGDTFRKTAPFTPSRSVSSRAVRVQRLAP